MTQEPEWQGKRAYYTKLGKETVERLIDLLLFHFGSAKYVNNFPDKVVVMENDGTNFKPDLELFSKHHYGIEVKGIQSHWHKRSDGIARVGTLKLSRAQWSHLEEWCTKNRATPLLMVEIKTKGRNTPYLYYVLGASAIEKLKQKIEGEWLSASVWDIIRVGSQLRLNDFSATRE